MPAVATPQILAIDPRVDPQVLQLNIEGVHHLGIFTAMTEKYGGRIRWGRGWWWPVKRFLHRGVKVLAELIGKRLPGRVAKLNPVLLTVE